MLIIAVISLCLYTYVGIPLKPLVAVQPGQLINLTANDLNFSMECGQHFRGNFNYQWEKKNERVHLSAQGIRSYRLTIKNLRVQDSGEYRCAISNFTGKIFSDYLLINVTGLFEMIMIYVYVYNHS